MSGEPMTPKTIGGRLTAELIRQRGIPEKVASYAAAGGGFGVVAAIRHPEWAAAFAQEALASTPELAESVDRLVASVPIEIVQAKP